VRLSPAEISGFSERVFVLEFQTRERPEVLQILEEDLAFVVEIDEAGEDTTTFWKAVPGRAVASPATLVRSLIAVDVASDTECHGKPAPWKPLSGQALVRSGGIVDQDRIFRPVLMGPEVVTPDDEHLRTFPRVLLTGRRFVREDHQELHGYGLLVLAIQK
jgi:hypothetical protein